MVTVLKNHLIIKKQRGCLIRSSHTQLKQTKKPILEDTALEITDYQIQRSRDMGKKILKMCIFNQKRGPMKRIIDHFLTQ
ncbi:TPA: hypothetical protein DDZ86_01685 [Candidatus Dependentiae bacterium]|nr:hypothetical protein [Candidatus Dependentiae bacterium]